MNHFLFLLKLWILSCFVCITKTDTPLGMIKCRHHAAEMALTSIPLHPTVCITVIGFLVFLRYVYEYSLYKLL